jgi:hypothetical protein
VRITHHEARSGRVRREFRREFIHGVIALKTVTLKTEYCSAELTKQPVTTAKKMGNFCEVPTRNAREARGLIRSVPNAVASGRLIADCQFPIVDLSSRRDPIGNRQSTIANEMTRRYRVSVLTSSVFNGSTFGSGSRECLICRQTHQATASKPTIPMTKSKRWNQVFKVSFLSHCSPSF